MQIFKQKYIIPATPETRILILRIARIFLASISLIGITSVVLLQGFNIDQSFREILKDANLFVLAGFQLYLIVRTVFTMNYRDYLRSHIPEITLFFLILFLWLGYEPIAKALVAPRFGMNEQDVTLWFYIFAQIIILFALSIEVIRHFKSLINFNIQPSALIALSFILVITIGTVLLMLPNATYTRGIPVEDALFTAASAVCVTGLTVVDTATYYTTFGQTIIMVLIQVGGLGIMTLTTFFAFFVGSGTRVKEYAAFQAMLESNSVKNLKILTRHILYSTFLVEFLGAMFLYFSFPADAFQNEGQRIFNSVFHSVSAFCNAGFALFSLNFADPITNGNVSLQLVIMVLIILGGIGFPVMSNYYLFVKSKLRKKTYRVRISVNTKMVTFTTLILIFGGAAFMFAVELQNSAMSLQFHEKILSSLFHSVSARTAGFNTVDVGAFTAPAAFILIGLMWVGASPAGTGGGIKTTTITLAILNIGAVVSGKDHVEMFGRRISEVAVIKAFSTIILSVFYISLATFVLILTEANKPFLDLLFEVVSAVGTVGLSRNLTPELSVAGKLVITLSMIVGRIGLLSTVMAITKQAARKRFDYPEENVLVT